MFDDPEEPTADCTEFAEVVAKVQAIQEMDPAEIESILNTTHISSGATYFDVIKSVASKYSFLRTMSRFIDLPILRKMPWIPSSTSSLVTEPVKRLLERELRTELAWWLETEGAVAISTTLLQTGLALLWS